MRKITAGFWCSDWKGGQNCAQLSRRWKYLTAPLPKRQVLDDEIVHCSDIWKTEGQDLLPVPISQECGVASNTLRILCRLAFIQRDSQIETNSPRFLEVRSMDGSMCVCPRPSVCPPTHLSVHACEHVQGTMRLTSALSWLWGSDPQGLSHLHLQNTVLPDWNSSPGHSRTYL